MGCLDVPRSLAHVTFSVEFMVVLVGLLGHAVRLSFAFAVRLRLWGLPLVCLFHSGGGGPLDQRSLVLQLTKPIKEDKEVLLNYGPLHRIKHKKDV